MTNIPYENFSKLVNKYDLFLFDLWGTLMEDEILYYRAIDMVNHLKSYKNVCLMSNSPLSSKSLCNRIGTMGIKIDCDKVFSSGEVAIKFLKPHQNDVFIYILGGQHILDSRYHITTDLSVANILLLNVSASENDDLNQYDDILKQVVKYNIKTICTNPDVTIPSAQGVLKYGPGFFAKKIEDMGGEVSYTGKPRAEIYNMAFDKFPNIPHSKTLMIGDTLETDVLGGVRNNIHSALVLTGNAYRFHKNFNKLEDKLKAVEQGAEEHGIIPTYITNLNN